jgi:general secretion pathway protein A
MNTLAVAPFGLVASPFTERGDDELFFFPGEQYLRALEFMGAALWTRTHVGVVTADEGCGKSLLIRRFVGALDERVLCAEVHRQDLTAREFLDDVLRQFGVELDESDRTDRRRVLTRFLNHQLNLGRICLIVVENPQTMPPLVLDEIKALSEIAVDGARVLKLLLVGQSLLSHVVDSPRMGELMRSGATRFALSALSEDQVGAYVAHRLRAAGAVDPDQLMPYTLMSKIHLYTGGAPALVNSLCTQALACAAVTTSPVVTMQALDEAIDILGLQPRAHGIVPAVAGAEPTSTIAAVLVLATQGMPDREVPLARNRILIGRGELADIRIDSVFVSRYHALIVRESTQDLLIDLGSTNGVLVNSKRVMRHVLRDRDLVQIGPARVTYLNAGAIGPVSPDPSQTVWFVRPGSGNTGAGSGGTVLAFGRLASKTPA